MANHNQDLELLIGKAISDPDFRRALIADPLGAVDQAGIALTPDQRFQLASFNSSELEQLAEEVDLRISRSAMGGVSTDSGGTGDTCTTYTTDGQCLLYAPLHIPLPGHGW